MKSSAKKSTAKKTTTRRPARRRTVKRKKTSSGKVILAVALGAVVVVGAVLLVRALSGGGGGDAGGGLFSGGGLFGRGANAASSVNGGLGGKPTPLPENVSYREAMTKVDEMWAYCDARPTARNKQVKSASTNWRSLIQPEGMWSLTGSTYISTINTYIGRLD